MGSQRWLKAAWCALFVCAAVGPHTLSAGGSSGDSATSASYAFVALGMLTGILAMRYPAVARILSRPAVWKTYLGVCLCMSVAPLVLDALDAVCGESFGTGGLGLLSGWVAKDLGSFRNAYAYLLSLLCCAASFCLEDVKTSVASPGHALHAWDCVGLLAAFLAGVMRGGAWAAFFTLSFGLPFLALALFCWVACMSRHRRMWSYIAAVEFGELAFRLLTRFGLALPLGAAADVPMIVGSLFLLGVSVIAPCLSRGECGGAGISNERGAFSGRAGDSRHGRLLQLGLSEREVDVLLLSAGGSNASQVASQLNMKASTVRTYRARICKKLKCDSFDQVLADCLAMQGAFKRSDAESRPGLRCDGARSNPAGRGGILAALHLAGLLSCFIVVLMPFGTLPAFWNSTWVMGYGLAVGVMASIALFAVLYSVRCTESGLYDSLVSVGVLVCAVSCVVVRMTMELGATGFGFCQRIGVFVPVAGFVCLALLRMHQVVGSTRLSRQCLGGACVAMAGLVAGAAILPAHWAVFVAASLLLYCVGMRQFCDASGGRSDILETSPFVGASWFVLAFVWEECWRGVRYSSMQDVGIPCLLVLAALDVVALRKNDDMGRGPCIALVGLASCIALAQDLIFALLTLVVILEVATCAVRARRSRPHRESGGPSLPPALLGLAVGCCTAVYISNARGAHALLNAGAASSIGLDWSALFCCAAFLLAALCRAVCPPSCEVPATAEVPEDRLRGYLVGNGLAPAEVEICLSLAHGDSVSQIAEGLSYSVSAIHALKRSAFAKLNVATRQQYIALLLRELNKAQG